MRLTLACIALSCSSVSLPLLQLPLSQAKKGKKLTYICRTHSAWCVHISVSGGNRGSARREWEKWSVKAITITRIWWFQESLQHMSALKHELISAFYWNKWKRREIITSVNVAKPGYCAHKLWPMKMNRRYERENCWVQITPLNSS